MEINDLLTPILKRKLIMVARKLRKGRETPQRVSADDKAFFVRDNDEEWESVKVGTNTPDEWNNGQALYDASDAAFQPTYPDNLPWPLLSDAEDNVVYINQQGIAKLPRYSIDVSGDLNQLNFCFYYNGDILNPALYSGDKLTEYNQVMDAKKEYLQFPYVNVKALPKGKFLPGIQPNFYLLGSYLTTFNDSHMREVVNNSQIGDSMRSIEFIKTQAPIAQTEGTDTNKQLGYSWKFSPRAFREAFSVFYPKSKGNGEVVIYNDYTFSYTGEVWVLVGEDEKSYYLVKLPDDATVSQSKRLVGQFSFFDVKRAAYWVITDRQLTTSTNFKEELKEAIKNKVAIAVDKAEVTKAASKPNNQQTPAIPPYRVENGSWEADSTNPSNIHQMNVFGWYRKESRVPNTFKRREVFVMKGYTSQFIFKQKRPLIFLDQLGLIPIHGGRFLIDLNEMKIRVEGNVVDEEGRLIANSPIRDQWMSISDYLDAKAKGVSFGVENWRNYPPISNEIVHVSYKNGIPSNLKLHYIPNKRWCTFNEETNIITCTRMIVMNDIYNRFEGRGKSNTTVPGPVTNVNKYVQSKCFLSLLEPWDSLGINTGATVDISYFPPKYNNNMNSFMPTFLLGGLFLNHDAFIEEQKMLFFTNPDNLMDDDEFIHPQEFYFSEKKEGRDLPNIDKISLFVKRLEFFLDPTYIKQRWYFDGLAFGDYPDARNDRPSMTLPAHLTKSTWKTFMTLCSETVRLTDFGRHDLYTLMSLPVLNFPETLGVEDEFVRDMDFNAPLSRYLDKEKEARLFFDNPPISRKNDLRAMYPGFKKNTAFSYGVDVIDTFLVRVVNGGKESYVRVDLAKIIDNNAEQIKLFGRSFTYAERRFFKTTMIENDRILRSIGSYYDNRSDSPSLSGTFDWYKTWYFNSGFTIGKEIYSPAIEYYGGLYYRFELEDGTTPEGGFDVIDFMTGENDQARMKLLNPIVAVTRMGGNELKIKFKNYTRYPYGNYVNHAFAMDAERINGSNFRDGLETNSNFYDRILDPKQLTMKIVDDPKFDYENYAFSAFHWQIDRNMIKKNDAFKDPDGPSPTGNNLYSVPYLEWNGTIENSFFRYPNKHIMRSFLFTSGVVVPENESVDPNPRSNRWELAAQNSINGGETPFNYWKIGVTDERGRIIKPNANLADVLNKVETAFYPPYGISYTTNNLNEDQPYYVLPNEMRYFRPDKVVERDDWFKTIPEEKQFRVTERVTPEIAKQISDFFTCTPKEFMETYVPAEERGKNVEVWRQNNRSFPIKYYFTPLKSGRLQTELIDLTGVSKMNKTKLGEYTPYTLDEDMDNTIRLTDDYGLLTGSGLTFRPSYRIRTNIDSNNTHRILVKNFDNYGLPVSINKSGIKDVAIADYWDTYKLGVK